jgi:putative FmdB family regulatory protein
VPLFDYRCLDCGKKFTVLVGVVSESDEGTCPKCGSMNVDRLISRVSRLRSEDDVMDDLADPSKMGDLDDPRKLSGWMKRVGREMGEDLGDEFGDVLDGAAEDGHFDEPE